MKMLKLLFYLFIFLSFFIVTASVGSKEPHSSWSTLGDHKILENEYFSIPINNSFPLDTPEATKGSLSDKFSDLRQSLRKDRRRIKMQIKNIVKRDNKYIRYNARRRSRRVWELTYNVEARRLDSVKLILMGKDPSKMDSLIDEIHVPNPPVEIHEYDGVRLNFINVNPFIYNIDLKEIHTDHINSEELSSSSINVNLQYQIAPIKMLNAKMPMSLVLDSNQLKLMQSISSNLSKIKELQAAICPEKIEAAKVSKGLINQKESEPELEEDTTGINIESAVSVNPLKQDSLNRVIEDSLRKENDEQISQIKDSVRKDEVNLDQAFYDFLKNPESFYDTSKREDLLKAQNSQAFKLEKQAEVLSKDLDEINKFVIFHNQFVGVLNMPHNSYDEVDSTRMCLIESFYNFSDLCCIDSTVANLLFKYKADLAKLRSTLNVVHQSGLFKNSVFAFDLGAFQEQINAVAFEVQSINFDSMIKRIRDMNALIREENFRLTYESFDVAENADYLAFNVSFKQAVALDVPRGKGSFNFEIGFLIREGVKIDLTPTLMYEYGLIPAQYYFETAGQEPGFAVVEEKQRDQSAMGVGVLMNVYKRSSANFKFGASVGFGIGQNVSPRFSIGPTLIVGRKERAVITTGAIFGPQFLPIARYGTEQVVEINEDLLQSGVPMETRGIGTGFYFGIGFNLFGAKNKEFFNAGMGRFSK